MAVELSRRLGWLTDADVSRVDSLLQRAGLPVQATVGGGYLSGTPQHDKKVQDGVLRLVLFAGIGRGVVSDAATTDQIEAAIMARCAETGADAPSGASQHLELTGVSRYIPRSPQRFVQAGARRLFSPLASPKFIEGTRVMEPAVPERQGLYDPPTSTTLAAWVLLPMSKARRVTASSSRVC